ncbi:MAG TPA: TonB-dependent receptor [Gemmatimonadales bacterium]|nr:TonB-dependent receptor [Gemmatimonadales bacterium]
MRASVLSLFAAMVLAWPTPLFGQTTTGTVRGYVRDANGVPLGGAQVQARNVETGLERIATTRGDGAYALPGLPPGAYELAVRHIGSIPQRRQVVVPIGATLLVHFELQAGAVELEAVTVAAGAPIVELRTSEVATNITQQQINDLPTANRNIFDLAGLAPGVITQNDRINSTRRTFVAGVACPQCTDLVNVFIDGVTYKNDLLRGGGVGQDRSRGNMFLRNAVQEFRVLTQNYKAEYQKASSGLLTATTKSGTNVFRGTAFVNYQDDGLVALDSFQVRDKSASPATFREPDYTRYQLGLSAGGPIIQDRLHYFVAYEGNYQDRTSRVGINVPPPGTYPAVDTVNLAQYNGNFPSPFRETLVFGKLTYAATPRSSMELGVDIRRNSDIRDFGALFGRADHARQIAARLRVGVTTVRAKHTYASGPLLNETTVSFQDYRDRSDPDAPGTITRFFCCNFTAWVGSNVTVQRFTQRRLALRNDLTYSGLRKAGEHIIKTGVNLDVLHYDILKRNSENPLFVFTDADSFRIPEKLEFQYGDPNYGDRNLQLGVYVQDDWTPTPRLTLNLGIRWDYESNMINTDYRTPQDVVDTLTAYQSQLFVPLDRNRYFTDGDDRSPFLGAFQPRLGFSYQVDDEGRTTIFGGWGIFYDRSVYDVMQQEKEALQHPFYRIFFRRFPADTADPSKTPWDPAYMSMTPEEILAAVGPQAAAREVKLLPNDLEPPKANHFSLGVRQVLGKWVVRAAYTGMRSSNVFTFYWANIDFPCGNGSCFTFRSIPGFTSVLFGTNAGKTWYDALQVQIDRPYRQSAEGSGWGGGLAYTLAKRQTEGFFDDFSFPNGKFYPKQVRGDERSRLVANWIVDLPYLYGVQFSGLLTLGSGQKFDVGDRFNDGTLGDRTLSELGGFTPDRYNFIIPNAWAFRTVDLGLRKQFPQLGGTALAVRVDLFNAFNYQNLGCYDTFDRGSPNFGKANCVVSDPRRLQIGAEYNF